ncbi:MAG: hypothetical protein IJ808_00195 [Muribaculaceae bacterium]|nr:hypothetical protein [Muribaculaceae bacterium]
MKRIIFSLMLLMALCVTTVARDKNVPDFNYPQNVTKQAEADLQKALNSGDGQLIVDAIVRASLAQSQISRDNLPSIIKRIEKTAQKEKRSPYSALLRYFQASVLSSYKSAFISSYRVNPIGMSDSDKKEEANENPYDAWDVARFDSCIDSLINLAVADSAALTAVPLTSMPDIIKCNELGAKYLPTLYQFIIFHGLALTDKSSSKLYQSWLGSTQQDLAAQLYARNHYIERLGYNASAQKSVSEQRMDLYNENAHAEESGYLLTHLSADKYYDTFCDYVKRWPKSIYTPTVTNIIRSIERKRVGITHNGNFSNDEPIHITAQTRNVSDYDVLVYRLPDGLVAESKLTAKQLKLVSTTHRTLATGGKFPFELRDTFDIAPLPFGKYIITTAYQAEGKTITSDLQRNKVIAVYNLASFNVARTDGINHLIAVNIKNGAAVSGATMTDEKGWSAVTNSDGVATVPVNRGNSSFSYYTRKGDDRYGPLTDFRRNADYTTSVTSAELFTDLGIYRPDETLKWTGILYEQEQESRRVLAGKKVIVTLRDANDKEVKADTLVTDAYGRAQGEFLIPNDRMLGSYSLILSHNDNQYAYHSINVSDYKTPTFYVQFPQEHLSFQKGEPITVRGNAKTYSGMPLTNCEVKLSLSRNEWDWLWWRCFPRSRSTAVADTIITTDKDGQFEVTFADSLFRELNGDRFIPCYYSYQAHAQVTDATGESQEASAAFHIGNKRQLTLNGPIQHLNTGALRLPVTVSSTDSADFMLPLTFAVESMTDDTLLTGSTSQQNPVIDLTRMASGQYRLRVAVDGSKESNDFSRVNLYLYRMNDAQAPVPDHPLWVPSNGYYVDNNNVAHITIGTSTPEANIYYVASGRKQIIAEGWLHYKSGMHDFTINVPQRADEIIGVQLFTVCNSNFYEENVTMTAPRNRRGMQIKVTAFRDQLTPGQSERWTMQLTDAQGKPQQGAMLLEMYDKALNSLADNSWSFSPSYLYSNPVQVRHTYLGNITNTYNYWQAHTLDVKDRYQIPQLYTYGTTLWAGIPMPTYHFDYLSRTLADVKAAPVYKSADRRLEGQAAGVAVDYNMDAADEVFLAVEEAATDAEVDEERLAQVEMRLADVKTALWKPMLTSDAQGNISIEFEAPNFNTTWLVQALAYTPDLAAGKMTREVLTRKPLMVKSSLPRFVRHGDQVRFAANLQNATQQVSEADAILEIFDPRTEQVYASRKFHESLDSMGTRPLFIEWNVPDTLAFVGFRVKAANATFGDGEQVMIPVLEAVSPIVETQPFFIGTDRSTYTFTLPETPDNARVTLEYCDNPVWYCVTALPSIMSDNNQVATSLANSLFALNVARGIMNSQPIIKEAFNYWQENAQDSMLVSALSRNSDLKITTLMQSPWLRTAERKTLQMQQLADYFDPAKAQSRHEALVSALANLQRPDGGFTWFDYPNCKSSLWATSQVLELLGELRHLGYQPNDERLAEITNKALSYFDREYLALSKKKENKKAIYPTYAYVRSLFPDAPKSNDTKKLLSNTINGMAKQWGKRNLSLSNKAFYAVTLNRAGKRAEALRIIESIRQFSIVKPDLGRYWDSYGSNGWFTPSQIGVTSIVLQAMHEVDPKQEELDEVRQWMLLSKRATDWGSSSLAADAVYALLSSGSSWLERSHAPEITIDGTPVTLDPFDAYVGYSRCDVQAHTGSTFVVTRAGDTPAWGGIYRQFSQAMNEVKEVSIDEASISKEFFAYDAAGKPQAGSAISTGDKVQVRMVIVTSQDMDYVTITDERAACFEPTDKTSGYRYQEGVGYYRETRDAATNIFINHLPKGTHVITYDVYATQPGSFSSGVATLQSQQAPEMSAHSAGKTLLVK